MHRTESNQTSQHLKLVSFDVFDTLLIRRVVEPEAVFYFAAVSAIQEEIIACTPEAYVSIRKEAEKIACHGEKDWQTDAPRIFQVLSRLLSLTPEESSRLYSLELQWEKTLLVVVPGVAPMLEKERQEGYTIAFVSDMYLSSEDIKMFLTCAGLFRAGDIVFVSGEHRASKSTGRLFDKLVSDHPQSLRKEIRHYGNDYLIDYRGALKAGLIGKHLTRCNPTRYEALLEKRRGETNGLSSLLAGTSRLLRLNFDHQPYKIAALAKIVGGVIAPVMTLYVLWILEEAKRKGIKQLCFISRDGYVPFLICKKICSSLGYPIEAVYLYGSRQSWHLPGLTVFNDSTYAWLLQNFEGNTTIETVLNRVGMLWGDLLKVVPEAKQLFNSPHQALTSQNRSKLQALLDSNKSLQEHILANANAKREVLLAYFEQEGLSFDQKTGMVDLGWTGRSGSSLKRIIGKDKSDNLQWFYFGILSDKYLDQPEKVSTFLFGPDLPLDVIQGLPPIIETFCFAPHGSVVDFKRSDKIHAVFSSMGEQELDDWGRSQFLAMIEKYCELLPLDIIRSRKFYHLRKPAHDLLETFINTPTKEEAEIWGGVPFIQDHSGKKSTILAPKPYVLTHTIKDALVFGKFSQMAQGGELGVWGAASWAKRDWKIFPLYPFLFIGRARIKMKNFSLKMVHKLKLFRKTY